MYCGVVIGVKPPHSTAPKDFYDNIRPLPHPLPHPDPLTKRYTKLIGRQLLAIR